MRIIIFMFVFVLFGCESEQSQKVENQKEPTAETKGSSNEMESIGIKKYKKTASNSEFAVFRTITADETHTTYFFKTLDGVSLDFKVSINGEPKIIVPRNLLEHAKYLEGHPGANPEMTGRVFELIYDKDNYVGEVKLAEEE